MSLVAREFAEDPCFSLKRGNMVRAVRNLLLAVTRLLFLAEVVDVHLKIIRLRDNLAAARAILKKFQYAVNCI